MPNITLFLAQIEQIIWARPLSAGTLVAIFAAITLLSIYLYRKPWGLPLWLRAILVSIRVLALSLIVVILLEPTAVVKETHTRTRSFPVLLDASESMSMKDQRKRAEDVIDAAAALNLLPDDEEISSDQAVMALDAKQRQAITNASRLDLGSAILSQSGRPMFESLSESLDLSYHVFGETPRLIKDGASVTADELKGVEAIAPGTSIAASLEAVANSGGVPPAGILLLSDGIGNATSERSEAILKDLGARGIPVYTVPLGLADPDDISIRNIVTQEVAFSGDRVPVRVHIQSAGYEQRTVRLSVLLNDRRVSSRMIRLTGGLQFEDVDFQVDIYEKGAAKIDVVLEPFDDEVSAANNTITRSIRIVNEKVNVLYIEGNARWEFRYLRAILERDPRIDATFIASNVGPEFARNSPHHIERFPNTQEEAFKYDLVILGDVDSSFFTSEELELLEKLIRDRGASLIMLCGPMHSPMSYAGTPVETMLPVNFDSEAEWNKVARSVYPVLTPEGKSSLVMTLESNDELNDRAWSRMAPMDQLPPLTSAKPAATVLTVLSDSTSRNQGYPLVAWQRYGTGKCMSIASDRLWRLRYKTGDKYHWRVWSQCIQFMTLSRLMGEHKRIRLETDRSTYSLDGQCRLYAHVMDESFEPISESVFEAYVTSTSADGEQIRQQVNLRPDASQPGLYEGYYTPPKAGRYRLEANDADKTISSSTEFQVSDMRKELQDTSMRPENLQRISDLTGGTKLGIRELNKLNNLINSDPVTTTLRSERPLWDSMWMVLLLAILLGGEWILRRRNDLP